MREALGKGVFTARGQGSQASWHVQEETVQEALSGAHTLILLAEALRLAVVCAGVRYRALFAWLLTTLRRMSNEEPNAQKHHFQTDAQALSDFIHSQLFQDAIGPQLHLVRCFCCACASVFIIPCPVAELRV